MSAGTQDADHDRCADDTLVERFKASRSEEDFAQIQRRFGPLVHAASSRVLANRADLEEATQDTFVNVFYKIDSYQGGNFRGWLYTIARHAALNRLARLSGRDETAASASDALPLDSRSMDEHLSWFSLKWRVAVLSKLEFRRFAAGVFKA